MNFGLTSAASISPTANNIDPRFQRDDARAISDPDLNSDKRAYSVRNFSLMVATATAILVVGAGYIEEPGGKLDGSEPGAKGSRVSQLFGSHTIKARPAVIQDAYSLGEIKIHPPTKTANFLLINEIGSKWKVSKPMSSQVVKLAFKIGQEKHTDPLLILSIMAAESSFNANAKSHVGAEGLMQVWRKWHQEKFKGIGKKQKATPEQNIRIGTQILTEYVERSNGNFRDALQRYNGTLDDATQEYANKVIVQHRQFVSIYQRSNQMAMEAQRVHVEMARRTASVERPADNDIVPGIMTRRM